MAGICLGAQPGSKAYPSILELSCVVWHHSTLHNEFWLKVKDKTSFLSAALVSCSVLQAASVVTQKCVTRVKRRRFDLADREVQSWHPGGS